MLTIELTAAELADLRRRVSTAHLHQRKPRPTNSQPTQSHSSSIGVGDRGGAAAGGGGAGAGRGGSPGVWIEYIDGPLMGIRHPIDASAARSSHVAWCTVRPDGPYVLLHAPADAADRTRWRFIGWESPGIR